MALEGPYLNKKYFGSDGDCFLHREYKCDDCVEKIMKGSGEDVSILPAIVVDDKAYSNVDKHDAEESFDRQVSYVQEALDYTDKKMEHVRVKDMPKLVQEAHDKITVGKMKKLLGKNKSPKPGFVDKFIAWLERKLDK